MSNSIDWLRTLRESEWVQVVPVLLDVMSGKVVAAPESYHEFWWTEGDGSCDCNRAAMFGHDNYTEGFCDNCARYVVVDVDRVQVEAFSVYGRASICPHAIAEFVKTCNREYPEIARKMALGEFIGRCMDRRPL